MKGMHVIKLTFDIIKCVPDSRSALYVLFKYVLTENKCTAL